MAASFARTSAPKATNKIMTMVEAGMDTDAIAAALQERADLKHVVATEGLGAVPGGEEEAFPREIRLIAQALAFTSDVTEADVFRVHSVLSAAYVAECGGAEAFRGGPALGRAAVEALVSDPCYRWVLVEAPNGHRAEEDGALLGACCYTTDGVSRKNGEVREKRAHQYARHLFLVFQPLPPTHCPHASASVEPVGGGDARVGPFVRRAAAVPRPVHRAAPVAARRGGHVSGQAARACMPLVSPSLLLHPPRPCYYNMLFQAGCCRAMLCLPSPRAGLGKWAERRGYVRAGATPYPAAGLGHVLTRPQDDVALVRCGATGRWGGCGVPRSPGLHHRRTHTRAATRSAVLCSSTLQVPQGAGDGGRHHGRRRVEGQDACRAAHRRRGR